MASVAEKLEAMAKAVGADDERSLGTLWADLELPTDSDIPGILKGLYQGAEDDSADSTTSEDADDGKAVSRAALTALVDASGRLLLRRLTLAALRKARLVRLLGRFAARLGPDAFKAPLRADPALPLGILAQLWEKPTTVYRIAPELCGRLEVLRLITREFASRLDKVVELGLVLPDHSVCRSDPLPEDYDALIATLDAGPSDSEEEEVPEEEEDEDFTEEVELEECGTLVWARELFDLPEAVVSLVVGRAWIPGALSILKEMETVDWNFEELDILEANASLLGLSTMVRKKLPAVLKFAVDMVDIRPAENFTNIMHAAYTATPGGLQPRIKTYKYHFFSFGHSFALSKFTGEKWKEELTTLLNRLNSGSLGAGEGDPRQEKLCGEVLWFFLVNPRSTIWVVLGQALEKDYLLSVIAVVLRHLRVVAERTEKGIPLGIAAVSRLLEKSPEIIYKVDKDGDAYISLVAQLCRHGKESRPFIDPTQLILKFICPSLEKDRGAGSAILLRLFHKLIKHRETSVLWNVRNPADEAWEGEPKEAPDKAEAPRVQFSVVLELMMSVWVRAAEAGRNCARVRQLAFKVVRSLLGEVGKKLGARMDVASLTWLTEDRLNNFPWQYKTAVLDWLPEITDQEMHKKEFPLCLIERMPAETAKRFKGINCGAHRNPSHRQDAEGMDSCALDSLLELFLVSEETAVELVKEGLTFKEISFLEEKLLSKVGERLLRDDGLDSDDAIAALVRLVAALDPERGRAVTGSAWSSTKAAHHGILFTSDAVFIANALNLALIKAKTNNMYMPGEDGFAVLLSKVESMVGRVVVLFKDVARGLAERCLSLPGDRLGPAKRSEEGAGVAALFTVSVQLASAYRALPKTGGREPRSLQVLSVELTKQAGARGFFEEPEEVKVEVPPPSRPEESYPLPPAVVAKIGAGGDAPEKKESDSSLLGAFSDVGSLRPSVCPLAAIQAASAELPVPNFFPGPSPVSESSPVALPSPVDAAPEEEEEEERVKPLGSLIGRGQRRVAPRPPTGRAILGSIPERAQAQWTAVAEANLSSESAGLVGREVGRATGAAEAKGRPTQRGHASPFPGGPQGNRGASRGGSERSDWRK